MSTPKQNKQAIEANMLTVTQIRKALQDRRLMFVAEATGLHYNTLRELRDNPEANPSARTLEKITDYLLGVSDDC